jgi:hypothetical protein
MRLARVRPPDRHALGRTLRPGTEGPHRAIGLGGTVPCIGPAPGTDALRIRTCTLAGVGGVNPCSGAGRHDRVASGVDVFEFNADLRSEIGHPVIDRERHICRPRP